MGLVKTFDFQSNFNRDQAEGAVEYYVKVDQREAELRASAPAAILEEKRQIDAAIASGRTMVANQVDSTFVIHRFNCHAIRHQVDRDEAWRFWLEDETGRSDKYPMPHLVTPAEVEGLPVYRACLTCNPNTAQRKKNRVAQVRPTALRNISTRHLGREFETLAGAPLGELVAYTVATDSVTLRFMAGDLIATHDDEVVMLPKAP